MKFARSQQEKKQGYPRIYPREPRRGCQHTWNLHGRAAAASQNPLCRQSLPALTALLSLLTRSTFWQGSGEENTESEMQLPVHDSITVCNQLSGFLHKNKEGERGGSENQTELGGSQTCQ